MAPESPISIKENIYEIILYKKKTKRKICMLYIFNECFGVFHNNSEYEFYSVEDWTMMTPESPISIKENVYEIITAKKSTRNISMLYTLNECFGVFSH